MFESMALKNAAIGAGIALSAFSFSAPAEAAQNQSTARVAAAQARDVDDLSAEVLSDRVSGALKDVKPPAYDGPIAWNRYPSTGERVSVGILVGGLGAALGGVVASSYAPYRKEGRAFVVGAAAGASLITGGILLLPSHETVEFNTTVQSVESAAAPHMETRRSGKRNVTTGPYFSQLVTIPETDMLLATNAAGAPLVPGQKITAKFYVNADNQILAWSASPGPRTPK